MRVGTMNARMSRCSRTRSLDGEAHRCSEVSSEEKIDPVLPELLCQAFAAGPLIYDLDSEVRTVCVRDEFLLHAAGRPTEVRAIEQDHSTPSIVVMLTTTTNLRVARDADLCSLVVTEKAVEALLKDADNLVDAALDRPVFNLYRHVS